MLRFCGIYGQEKTIRWRSHLTLHSILHFFSLPSSPLLMYFSYCFLLSFSQSHTMLYNSDQGAVWWNRFYPFSWIIIFQSCGKEDQKIKYSWPSGGYQPLFYTHIISPINSNINSYHTCTVLQNQLYSLTLKLIVWKPLNAHAL